MGRLENIQEQIKTCFKTEARFTFEKRLGSGANGAAFLFLDTAKDAPIPRFVVKVNVRGLSEDIKKEERWLTRLRWAEHVVNILEINPDPLRSEESNGGNPIGYGGSYIIIEYLQGGSLTTFLKRLKDGGITPLPNRLLWALFLCLVQGCVGMAHPPQEADPVERLPVDPEVEPPSALGHDDMHLENMMFGELDQELHKILPILKIIDFGEAALKEDREVASSTKLLKTFDGVLGLPEKSFEDYEAFDKHRSEVRAATTKLAGYLKGVLGHNEEPFMAPAMAEYLHKFGEVDLDEGVGGDGEGPDFEYLTKWQSNRGTEGNICNTGVVLGCLITEKPSSMIVDVRHDILPLVRDKEASGRADLDADLLLLVARCLARDPANRPKLPALFAAVCYHFLTKTEEAYPGVRREMNEYIRELAREYILSAETKGTVADPMVISS